MEQLLSQRPAGLPAKWGRAGETEVEGGSHLEQGVGDRYLFPTVALWPVDLLQPPEAGVAWKHSWTQASLGNGCTQAGRQRPPIGREIQVSKEPSGSLATGAEVGQCPQLGAVSFLRPHREGDRSSFPRAKPSSGVASAPHSRAEHASFIPKETEAAGGHLMGHPTQPGSGKAEMEARYPHLSGPGPSIRQMF